MASAWDFAPAAIVVETDDVEATPEDDEAQPLACSATASFWNPALSHQRWLVVAVSLLFLYWVWSSDDRVSTVSSERSHHPGKDSAVRVPVDAVTA